ncbi:prepilin peptidase [Paenibacillus sp. GYB003]|uniref:prepilin peptidase n=1 Tax=Paenibacillus sp. GYB003 TaxID=2994392 RepID=UPI002F9688C0
MDPYTLYMLLFPFIVVLGLLTGSFLNVVALRSLTGESIVLPPSRCVRCKHPLKPTDLIPLLGYLLLRGKCRYCRGPISPVYPAVEAAVALSFALIYREIGWSAELLPGFLLVSVLAAVVVTDLKSGIIPDRIVFPCMAMAAVLRLGVHPLPLWDYAAAFFAGSGILWLLAVVSKGGMGGGDIKLFALIGLLLGLKLTLLALFAASLAGTLYGVGMLLAGRLRRKQAVPFGPFIATAALPVYLWGSPMLAVLGLPPFPA